MESFIGHAFPGLAFILISIWHILNISSRFFKSKQPHGTPFKGSTYFVCFCGVCIPIESLLKVVATTITSVGDAIIRVQYRNGCQKTFELRNLQHITIYTFFGVSGLVETLHHYRFRLPPRFIYLSNILAFSIEALLIYWQLLAGRPIIDSQLHWILICINLLTATSLAIEMMNRSIVLPPIISGFLMLLQGITLWQIAFVLYPQGEMTPWELDSHDELMLSAILFCSGILFSFVLTLSIWMLVAFKYQSCRRSSNPSVLYLSLEAAKGEEAAQLLSENDDD